MATGFVLALLLTFISIKERLNPVKDTEDALLDDKLNNDLDSDRL